jgi:hypothetical protein
MGTMRHQEPDDDRPASGETQGREVVTGQTCFLANAVVRSVIAKTTEFRPQQACHGPELGRSHTAESGRVASCMPR